MAEAGVEDPPVQIKKPKLSTNLGLCIICQEQGGYLTESPTYEVVENLMSCVQSLSGYGYKTYPELYQRLSLTEIQSYIEAGSSWHRECYSESTNKSNLYRAKCRFESSRSMSEQSYNIKNPKTRKSSATFNRDNCIFCQLPGSRRKPLSQVKSIDSLQKVQRVAQKDKFSHLCVLLDIGIENIENIDIVGKNLFYHKSCWGKNVSYELTRNNDIESKRKSKLLAEKVFLSEAEAILNSNSFETVSNLTEILNDIRHSHGITDHDVINRDTKLILQEHMTGILFSKPVRANEAERVSRIEVKDTALQDFERSEKSSNQDEKLRSAAITLRNAILQADTWQFKGSLDIDSVGNNVIPDILVNFLQLLLTGKSTLDKTCTMASVSHSRAVNLAQIVMFSALTRKQTHDNKMTSTVRNSIDLPLQVGVGLSMHATFRSKEAIDILHGLGVSVDYQKVVKIENQLANHVITQMEESESGILSYIPSHFVENRHIFFAVDNCDFQEDTFDGKNTLHGTVMNIYQKTEHSETNTAVEIDPETSMSLENIGLFSPILTACHIPPKPNCRKFDEVEFLYDKETKPQLNWVLMASEMIQNTNPTDGSSSKLSEDLPLTWAAYNSVIHDRPNVTRISTPPLLAAPAHEMSTLMHVFKQANEIKTRVVGQGSKTIITLDMGLYLPAQKLLMAKRDQFVDLVVRPGELHIVIAMLRTIGSYITNSGIDCLWMQSGLYGQNTVNQIINGNHVKRGMRAHTTTLVVLTKLYMTAFYDSSEFNTAIKEDLSEKVRALHHASTKDTDTVKEKADALERFLDENQVRRLMSQFEENGCCLQKSVITYMKMVMCLLQFVHAVRGAHWHLHLQSLHAFCKYFFSLDRLNYARMIPLYLAEMESLKTSDSQLWQEFESGNWVVNRSRTPFCSLGADHALEQINRSMKVSGGLIGITANEKARARFFLVSPELSHYKHETKIMANMVSQDNDTHHELNKSSSTKLAESVLTLEKTVSSFVDPFRYEGNDVINLVSNAVMPNKVKEDILNVEKIGQKKLTEFIETRIQKADTAIWEPMKKANLQLWKSTTKKVPITINDKVTELREDRGLFARLLIVANSRPEVDLQRTLGEFELSVVPRSLFDSNGRLHHCSDKSQLMTILEQKIAGKTENEPGTKQVAVIDAMNIVQSLSKPKWIKTADDLAKHFTDVVVQRYYGYEEVHLVFDRYNVDTSLKAATRDIRLGGRQSIAYHISKATQLGNVDMKMLLSSSETKDELTAFFAENLVEKMSGGSTTYVVSYRERVIATHDDFTHLDSNHEEADTKLILHAVDASKRGVLNLHIYSMDTDVLVLCIRRFPTYFPENTVFITGTGENKRQIIIKDIVESIGLAYAEALPAFHAFSGADITGSVTGKGKLLYWRAFEKADANVIKAFKLVSDGNEINSETETLIEKFVCQLFQPGTGIDKLADLRWWMFRRKQAESEKLPPTKAAFVQYLLRTLYQCKIWNSDLVPKPDGPDPESYGWKWDSNGYTPIMTTNPPAPTAILELVKCGCTKSLCNTNRCKCTANNLLCTELCACGAEEDTCLNGPKIN